MVNPVSPLIEGADIDAAIQHYEKVGCDTLLSVRDERLHAFYRDEPLNFSTDGLLPMTQDLDPVRICVWTISIWRRSVFLDSYRKHGHAVFSGRLAFLPIDPLKSLKISYESELRMAEQLIGSAMRRE
jgi:CMP-N-acetylneuraminic acid synthetase